MKNIKEVIEAKIENCKNDIIATKNKINAVYGKSDDVGYMDTDTMEQCRQLSYKIERLKGELDAYIDCAYLYNENNNVMSLREYINEHSNGAYIHFNFYIGPNEFNVISVEDFCKIGNEKILDEYYVDDVEKEDNGAGCDQYYCKHTLDLIGKWEMEQK